MRIIGKVLLIAGLGLCLIGLLFGRASWVGVNGRAIATWVLIEFAGAILVMISLASRLIRKHD